MVQRIYYPRIVSRHFMLEGSIDTVTSYARSGDSQRQPQTAGLLSTQQLGRLPLKGSPDSNVSIHA
jgi:hypothetical protein